MIKSCNRLMIASSNSYKIKEIAIMLSPLNIEIVSQPKDIEVEENGITYLENARLKATTVAKLSGYWTLGDDSGLEIDALGGSPGVYSARYGINDDEKINRVLNELDGSHYRTASFNTFMCLASPIGEIVTESQGVCKGEILTTPSGKSTGYDSIFWLRELNTTYANIPQHLKDKIGSRGKAARAIGQDLRRCLVV